MGNELILEKLKQSIYSLLACFLFWPAGIYARDYENFELDERYGNHSSIWPLLTFILIIVVIWYINEMTFKKWRYEKRYKSFREDEKKRIDQLAEQHLKEQREDEDK